MTRYSWPIVLLLLSLAVGIMSGCSAEQSRSGTIQGAVASAATKTTENVITDPLSGATEPPITMVGDTIVISDHVDMARVYNDYPSLIEAAQNIAWVKCTGSEVVYQRDVMFTISTVKVEKVYKGGFKVGSDVLIDEVGGTTTLGDYVSNTHPVEKDFGDASKVDPAQKLLVGLDGFFPMKPGEDLLLFANSSEGFFKSVPGNTYHIVGTYMGKFARVDGSVERAQPAGWEDYPTLKASETEVDSMLSRLSAGQ